MGRAEEVAVIPSAKLFARMVDESRRSGVPLEWIAAALVADTLAQDGDTPRRAPGLGVRR